MRYDEPLGACTHSLRQGSLFPACASIHLILYLLHHLRQCTLSIRRYHLYTFIPGVSLFPPAPFSCSP